MGAIRVFDTPVQIDMNHNDVPVDQIDEGDWGVVDVYQITSLSVLNPTGGAWEFNVISAAGITNTVTIAAAEQKTVNLPNPRRFRSYPCTFHLTLKQRG